MSPTLYTAVVSSQLSGTMFCFRSGGKRRAGQQRRVLREERGERRGRTNAIGCLVQGNGSHLARAGSSERVGGEGRREDGGGREGKKKGSTPL